MTVRRRILFTYLTLALVVIGAVAHGFLSEPASRMRMMANGVSEGAGFADRGVLPTLRSTRPLSDWRKSRTPADREDDAALATSPFAVQGDAHLLTAAFIADTGRRLTMARRTHRPRDPPTPA
jgi:hypothetical protein